MVASYYFVRVNGETAHNDPSRRDCFVQGELPVFPNRHFDYTDYCLREGVVRIGWPAIGPLGDGRSVPRDTPCYGTLSPRVRRYLEAFREISKEDVVLMPDKREPGILHIGRVICGYWSRFALPEHPYECLHRVSVEWDRSEGMPARYRARDLSISIRGGFWRTAFHRLDAAKHTATIRQIDQAR